MSMPWALGCAITNLILPGIGTLVCAWHTDKNLNKTQFFMGLTQFMTSAWIFGYVLSVMWAYLFIRAMGKPSEESDKTKLMNGNMIRSDA